MAYYIQEILSYILGLFFSLLPTVYHVRVRTSPFGDADTDANVWIKIHGNNGVTDQIKLDDPNRDDFEVNRYLTSSIQSPGAYGAFLLTWLTAIFQTYWYKRKRKKNFFLIVICCLPT